MTKRVFGMLAVLVDVACSTLHAATLAANPFETMQGVTRWCMSSEATLSTASDVFKTGQHALRIDYKLPTPESQVTVRLGGFLESVPTRISLWVYGDGSRNLHGIRLQDQSGETHYYRLGLLPSRGWTRCVIDLANWSGHYDAWGGNRDRKIDLPITTVAYNIRSYSAYGTCAAEGSVVIDDLTVEGPASAPAESSGAEAGVKLLVSVQAPQAIRVDGRLDDWDRSAPVLIGKEQGTSVQGSIRDDADLSAAVYSTFDEQNVYFAAEVTDDVLAVPFSGTDIWQNDCIELWFDCRRDSFGPGQFGEPDDYQIVISAAEGDGVTQFHVYRNVKTAYLCAASEVACSRRDEGYTIEGRFPLAAFEGMAGKAGQFIGLNVSVCDNDGKSFTQHLWSGRRVGAPLDFGVLSFGPPSEVQRAAIRPQRERLALEREVAPVPDSGIGEVRANADPIPCFGKFELQLTLGVEPKNPYDPDDILLRARFISPSGKETEVDGFHIVPYRVAFKRVENLVEHGDAHWRVRFTPTEVGRYRYVLDLRDSSGTRHPPRAGEFECVPSGSSGFLRVSPTDCCYLQFDSGKPFIGIGVGGHLWGADRPGCVRKYRSWLSDLAAFGGNTISVTFETLGAGTFGLDYMAPLGANYDQENAARLDYVLDMAERRGVYLVVNLFQTALFQAKHWDRSRFNVERGGPCESAAGFFSHPRALDFQKQLLRYLIARWGYSPNVLIWELCNEVNYSEASEKRPEDVRKWHRDMAAYLREIDPNRHLVSTSFGSSEACEDPMVWALPEIDSTIIHSYANDTVQTLWHRLGIKRTYGKPCIGGESGIHFPIVDKAYEIDPAGLHFHNSHWASILSGGAGNVLHWWPSRYWDSLDLPRLFRPLADFCGGIDWPREGFERIKLEASRADVPEAELADVSHATSISWQSPPLTEFHLTGGDITSFREKRHIDDDPKVSLSRLPCGLLFGAAQEAMRRPVKLVFNSPVATAARLVLGAVAREGTTLAVAGPSSEQEVALTDRDNADNPYADELRAAVDLVLPAGESEWRLTNTGRGWCTIQRVQIAHFRRGDTLNQLMVIGLRGRGTSLLWFYDTHSSWYQQSIGKESKPFEGVVAKLPVVGNGTFRVEWWDTWRGGAIGRESVLTHDGFLHLAPPRFVRDIACRVRAAAENRR